MDETKRNRLKAALEDDEAFLSVLAQDARSDEYREMKQKTEAVPIPQGTSFGIMSRAGWILKPARN